MRNYSPYLIIAALSVMLLQQCNSRRQAETTALRNATALTDTVRHYTNRLGTQTAAIRTLETDRKSLQTLVISKDKTLAALAKDFGPVRAVAHYGTVTQLDTVHILYTDTLPCRFERTGKVNSDWYSFRYRSAQDGIRIDSLHLPNETFVITGYKRNGLFGPKVLTTTVTHSNPYVRSTSLRAAEVVIAEPWYKKWYVWLAAGVIGGFAAAQ